MKLKRINNEDWLFTPECEEDLDFLKDWEADKVDSIQTNNYSENIIIDNKKK